MIVQAFQESNQLAEQLLIEGFQHFRTGFYCFQQLLGTVEDAAILLLKNFFLLLLGVAKLLCQLIAFGYKNIRVNHAPPVQRGQSVTLTG